MTNKLSKHVQFSLEALKSNEKDIEEFEQSKEMREKMRKKRRKVKIAQLKKIYKK